MGGPTVDHLRCGEVALPWPPPPEVVMCWLQAVPVMVLQPADPGGAFEAAAWTD